MIGGFYIVGVAEIKKRKCLANNNSGKKNGKFFFENTCTLFMFLILDNVLSDKKQILTQVQK